MEVVELTENANKKIVEIAGKENLNPMIRAGIKGGGCSGYRYDLYFEQEENIKDTDHVLKFNDVTVVIDMVSATYLEGSTIDYIDGLTGAGFKFNNNQTKKTCGCGQSFTV